MKRLLLVFHTPSDNTRRMLEAMTQAIEKESLPRVECIAKAPLETSAEDVLNSDAIILGTTENLGYMSGALKDFFDRVYYPCLEVKQGLPVAAIVRAGHDGTGTCRALTTILTGLKWRWVQEIVLCKGPWQDDFLQECTDLAQAMAVALDEGMI